MHIVNTADRGLEGEEGFISKAVRYVWDPEQVSPPQVDKWGSASNEPLNFHSSVSFRIQLNGRQGAPVICVLSYCGTIV